MGQWAFVRPESTVNLVTNPSVELATTGWAANFGSVAQSSAEQSKGLYSLAHTFGGAVYASAYYNITLSTSTSYTISVDVKAPSGLPCRIYLWDTVASATLGEILTFTGDGNWHRYILTATVGANGACAVYIGKNNDSTSGTTNIDALQIEEKEYATIYCDGDQDGCAWSAAEHASTSSRDAQSAAGGRVIDLDDDDYGFEVDSAIGVGYAPIEIIDTLPAQGNGGDYQRTVARPRDFQLVGLIEGGSQTGYHTKRLNLIKAFNSHRLATEQPVQFRYTSNQRAVAIDGYYVGGLEKEELPGPNVEKPTLRFRAEDPFFRAVTGHSSGDRCGGQGAISADTRQTISNANAIIQRDPDGLWQALGSGVAGAAPIIDALAVGPDGSLYTGGFFTSIGGISANYIAKWDGSSWSALGSGLNGECMALAVAEDGTLYAGGKFTTAGGGGANYIAKWNGSSWSALGSGMNLDVYALVIGPDGTLYAGGDFTTAGGGGANRVAAWDGSSWSALGSGTGATVWALAIGADGTLYVGGNFTTAGGSSANYIAAWDGSSWSALGDGMDNTVRELVIGADDRVYIGGGFSTPYAYFAIWNGTSYSTLGEGAPGSVFAVAIDGDGVVYIGGILNYIIKWSGGDWANIETDLPDKAGPLPPVVRAIVVHADQSLTIGYDSTGSATAAGISSATNNGSANTYPIFKASGPGPIYQIVNYTSGDEIFFDNLTLLDGETVTLDLRPGKKTFISSFRGNIINTILEGSDVENFHLMPGENSISLFIDDATAEGFLIWDEFHWSFDGVAA